MDNNVSVTVHHRITFASHFGTEKYTWSKSIDMRHSSYKHSVKNRKLFWLRQTEPRQDIFLYGTCYMTVFSPEYLKGVAV